MTRHASATVRTVKDVRPKRPKIDRGEEIETLVRQIFKINVDLWCKENYKNGKMPDKEARGSVVDDLTASFTSSIETLTDAATDSYLSMIDDDGSVECPECQEVFELPEDFDDDDDDAEVDCPKCQHIFQPNSDDDDDGGPDDGEPAPQPEREPREPRRARR